MHQARFALLVLLVPLLLGSPNAAAQHAFPNAYSDVTVDFQGGTLSEYVQSLRNAYAEHNPNILIATDADDVRVPRVSLRGAPLFGAVHALSEIAQPGPNARLSVETVGQGPDSQLVYAIRVERFKSPIQASTARRIEVFTIREIVDPPAGEGMHIDEVIGVIKTAVALDDTTEAPEVRYHPASALVIVRGTHEQIGVVNEVLDRLSNDLNRHRAIEGATERERIEAEADLRQAEAEVRMSEAELDTALANLHNVHDMVEKSVASREQLIEAEANVRIAKLRQEQAQIEVEKRARLLKQLEAGAASDDGSASPELKQELESLRRTVKALTAQNEDLHHQLSLYQLQNDGQRTQPEKRR